MDPEKYRALFEECLNQLRFCFEVYEWQVQNNRYFLHEHPKNSWSWKIDFVQHVAGLAGVSRLDAAQCPFGQWSVDLDGQRGLVLKETGWLGNCPQVLRRLDRKCAKAT